MSVVEGRKVIVNKISELKFKFLLHCASRLHDSAWPARPPAKTGSGKTLSRSLKELEIETNPTPITLAEGKIWTISCHDVTSGLKIAGAQKLRTLTQRATCLWKNITSL